VKTHATATLGFVLVCFLPAAAHAQAPPPPSSGTLDAVVREVRLLRQTLERQTATAARAQLIIARLTLYDHRAARARDAVDRLEGEIANAERERDQLQAASREMARSLEQATDPDRRQQLESESRVIRKRIVEAEAQRSRTEARLAQAKQTLDVETGRYDELERWLNDLDRQLQTNQ
jgi:chromosome segregation ATPase